jgi:hypothetical protein
MITSLSQYPHNKVQLSTAFGMAQLQSNQVGPNFLGQSGLIVRAESALRALELIPKTEVSVGKDNVCQLFFRLFHESVI